MDKAVAPRTGRELSVTSEGKMTFSGFSSRWLVNLRTKYVEHFDLVICDETDLIPRSLYAGGEFVDSWRFHDQPKRGPAVIYRRTLTLGSSQFETSQYFDGNLEAERINLTASQAHRAPNNATTADPADVEDQLAQWYSQTPESLLKDLYGGGDRIWDLAAVHGARFLAARLLLSGKTLDEAIILSSVPRQYTKLEGAQRMRDELAEQGVDNVVAMEVIGTNWVRPNHRN
jgi:hypothetical protein